MLSLNSSWIPWAMVKSIRRSRYSPTSPLVRSVNSGSGAPSVCAHIEYVDGAESDQYRLILLGDVLVGFGVLLLAGSDHRGKDADALLSLHDLAAKLVPRIQPCDAGRIRLLPCDLEDVPKAVVVEFAHCGEVGGEAFRCVLPPSCSIRSSHVIGNDFASRSGPWVRWEGWRCCWFRSGWWWSEWCSFWVVPPFRMAVLCLLTNTPWPRPTPAGAASARGGFPTRRAAESRSAQAQRGRLGCLLSRARDGVPQGGLVSLPGARSASRRDRFYVVTGHMPRGKAMPKSVLSKELVTKDL